MCESDYSFELLRRHDEEVKANGSRRVNESPEHTCHVLVVESESEIGKTNIAFFFREFVNAKQKQTAIDDVLQEVSETKSQMLRGALVEETLIEMAIVSRNRTGLELRVLAVWANEYSCGPDLWCVKENENDLNSLNSSSSLTHFCHSG